MRLGSETGSLVNHVMTESRQPKPEVGMPATICGWSDRYPATVALVQGPFVAVRACDYRGEPGHDNAYTESQRYIYEENPNGSISWFKLEADGHYTPHRLNVETGRFIKQKGGGLILGRREAYRDPHM